MQSKSQSDALYSLRQKVSERLSARRFDHTLGVEREAARLGELFCPEKEFKLRAAALLHDITKEYPGEKQVKIFLMSSPADSDLIIPSKKVLHSFTAPEIIKSEFPEFADEEILDAVRYHTTGRRGMSLCEAIIFLSDYIEDTRTYDSCVRLRNMFWQKAEAANTKKELFDVLTSVLICAFDTTIVELLENRAVIDYNTVEARNYFLGSFNWQI